MKLQSADAAPSAHLAGAVGHPRDSLDLSRYMLATWNDHDFETRFAAFAFDDSIHWRVTNVSAAAGILLNQTNLTSPGSLTSAARVGAGLVGAVAYGESLGLVSLPAVTQSILRLLPASARYNATRLKLNVSLPAAQLTAVATPKELIDLLTLAANVSGVVDAVVEALEDAAGIARSRACVAFRQTNGCSGDGLRQQLPTPNPCPWLKSTVPADDTLGCADGTTCTGPRWWSCCNSRGGRARCPRNLPVMCARANGCDQGQDHCCETDCSAQGGVRGCPATRGDQTCDKVIPCALGDCPSGYCECAGGVKVKRVSCVAGSRAPFTCQDACFAGLSPASLNETLGINAVSIAAAAVRWERAFREAGYPLDDGSAAWPASLPTDVSFDGLRWVAGSSELELDHVRANVTLDMWPSRSAAAAAATTGGGGVSLVVSLGRVRYREKLAPEEAQAAGVSPADNSRRFRMVDGVNITLRTGNASAFGGTGQTSLLRAAPFELASDGSAQQQQLWDGAVLAVLGAAVLATAAASGGVNGTGIAGALSNAPDPLRWNASSPFTVLHNTSSPHALPAFLGETARAQYRAMTNRPAAVYDVKNHPLPLSVRQQATVEVVLSVIASLFILIPFCYIPAAFAVFVVKERTCKAKHLQFVSGVSPLSYWASAYAWDAAQYMVLVACAVAVFELYGNAIFMEAPLDRACTVLLFVTYGLASIPFAYCLSFLFDNHSTAQIAIMGINFTTGFVMVMANFIMRSLPKTRDTAAVLVQIYRVFPSYNFGECLINVSNAYYRRVVQGRDSPRWQAFHWKVGGRSLALMALEIPAYFALLMVIESGAWRRWALAARYALRRVAARVRGSGGGGGGGGGGAGVESKYAAGGADAGRPGSPRVVPGRPGGLVSSLAGDGAAPHTDIEEDEDVAAERAAVSTVMSAAAHDGGRGGGGRGGRAGPLTEAKTTLPVVLINELHKRYASRESSKGGNGEGCLRSYLPGCCFCLYDLAVGGYKLAKRCAAGDALKGTGHVAVQQLSLQIPRGQCFGFLGVNGAGKTSTLAMLTGDVMPTAGDAWIGGRSIVSEMQAVQRRVGYCPQFDPLLELMTGRETIRMYASLKGVPKRQLDATVEHYIRVVGLAKYGNKTSGSYSGGNKRKLSLAIALVGRPAVVLLDEPSTGMDPVSRRAM